MKGSGAGNVLASGFLLERVFPLSDEPMKTTNQPDILADRVRFDIIATTRSGRTWRIWTTADEVQYRVDHQQAEAMPIELFQLAAMAFVRYCEEIASGEDSEQCDNFYNMVHDSTKTPCEVAMSHPYWAQPDHEYNDVRFGFASLAIDIALDVQPSNLRISQ